VRATGGDFQKGKGIATAEDAQIALDPGVQNAPDFLPKV
jgi:hypothetical protein